jgi:hypothetical protein
MLFHETSQFSADGSCPKTTTSLAILSRIHVGNRRRCSQLQPTHSKKLPEERSEIQLSHYETRETQD